jgi:4-hydroxy-4-methyl-2-oxoglutarate aldolase
VPKRPDLHAVVAESGEAEGRIGGEPGQNSWVIDELQPGDVMVVDMFGKVRDGPFVGDNLATAVQTRTGAGAVIEGTIRDYQGVRELPNVTIFCRGVHPSFITEVTLLGINLPVRIGGATVLPGDAVLGTPTGVVFIPPHLVQEVVERSEEIQRRDAFSHQRLAEGRYTPGEVDRVWSPAIEADYRAWLVDRESR